MDNVTPPTGRAVPTPENYTILTVDLTAHLTEEQKKWPRARIVPSDTEGVALAVPVEPSTPAQLLPALGRMLAGGRASEAADLFARLRAIGKILKTSIEDGVLRVTITDVEA